MTWKLNVDGLHDLEPNQTKDCVLDVSRSKTKNILSLSATLMLLNAKTYTQKLSSSTQLFGILVTTNSSYFLCPAKTGRYWHGWENLYTSHSVFIIRKRTSRVFRHSNIIFSILLMVTECTLLVLLHQLTFTTELSVTFIIDLVLICRHTLPSVL